MILLFHKNNTDAINLVDVANNFVSKKANGKQLLANFNERCVHKGVLFDEIDTNSGIVKSVSIYLYVCMYTCMLYDLFFNV